MRYTIPVFLLVLAYWVITPAWSIADGGAAAPDAAVAPAGDTPQAEPHPYEIHAFVKHFLGALRNDHRGDPVRDAQTFRPWIDPAYLDRHGLAEGGLNMQTIDFLNMRLIDVAEDGQTAVCSIQREDETMLVVVFCVVKTREGIYIQPAAAPDEATGEFHPWIYLVEATELVGES